MADVDRKHVLEIEGPAPTRKKLRPSELPLSQAKRSAIDSLVHTFRKKGQYDSIRKELMAQYVASPAKEELVSALKELVDRETDRNPVLLSKDPRMATTLIEGAGERSDIYGNIMKTINTLLDQLLDSQGLPKMREYRVQEIGEEAAIDEADRGNKSEEDWAQEAAARRTERESIRELAREKEREQEREERARREECRRREKEEEEAREQARQEEKQRKRREREEREKEEEERIRWERERLEREREEERMRLKKEKDEHERNREARLQKIREEDAERERRIQEELGRRGRYRSGRAHSRTPDRDHDRHGRVRNRSRERSRSRSESRSRRRRRSQDRSRTRSQEHRKSVKAEDIKVDDDLALQLLLQEGEQMKRSRQRPAFERSESLEPPMRKTQPPASLMSRSLASARLVKYGSRDLLTPTKINRDEDTLMRDASPTDRRRETASKYRWDRRPDVSESHRSRRRSRSTSNRRHSWTRSRSRGSRVDKRSSRVEDDRYSRRDDERHSYRSYADKRRRDRDRSRSRETHYRNRKSRYASRSPSPPREERRRDRSRDHSRGSRYVRDRSPPLHRRHRSRSRSPENIDRYVPGGAGNRKRDSSRERRRDDSRDRASNYRSRDYDRWENGRERVSRRHESDCYQPSGNGASDFKDRDRDVKARDRSRSRSRGPGRDDKDRRRRARSSTRSSSRSRRR